MIVLRNKTFGEGFSGTVINNFDVLQNRINQKQAGGDAAGADRLRKVLEKAKADRNKTLPVPASSTKNLPVVVTKPTVPTTSIVPVTKGFKMGTAGKVGLGALAGLGIAYGGYKLLGGKKEKAYSDTKKGPKFSPGMHIDARDKNGRRICIPAYVDENGDLKELTEEIWKKYHPTEKKVL